MIQMDDTHCGDDDRERALSWAAGLSPFWPPYDGWAGPFYEGRSSESGERRGLLISGPSRNGNHLLHALLDDHAQLPRIAGEDGTLNAVYDALVADFEGTDSRLRSAEAGCFLRSLSGKGIEDKWAKLYRYQEGVADPDDASDRLWSGMYYGQGRTSFLYDYQDTQVKIDYPAFAAALDRALPAAPGEGGEGVPNCLHDLVTAYMRALCRLDPAHPERRAGLRSYDGITFGSGARGPLDYMLGHGDYLICVAPIRSFETYYFSFAKGFFDTRVIRDDILQEAWEHWSHKVTDYLVIKQRYPDRLGLVNFEALVTEGEATIRRVCAFLGIPFERTCTRPTVLGQPTKGNSSFPKDESDRGTVYAAPLQHRLPPEYVPEEARALWRAVRALSV